MSKATCLNQLVCIIQTFRFYSDGEICLCAFHVAGSVPPNLFVLQHFYLFIVSSFKNVQHILPQSGNFKNSLSFSTAFPWHGMYVTFMLNDLLFIGSCKMDRDKLNLLSLLPTLFVLSLFAFTRTLAIRDWHLVNKQINLNPICSQFCVCTWKGRECTRVRALACMQSVFYTNSKSVVYICIKPLISLYIKSSVPSIRLSHFSFQ